MIKTVLLIILSNKMIIYVRSYIRFMKLFVVFAKAEERISWKMPTYWDGHNIIHFAAFTKHLGIYPGPDAILHFSDELKSYKTSKGAIQLPYNQPIPIELIKDITCWCYQTGNHH